MTGDDSWAFGNGGFAKLYGDRLAESSLLDCHVATRWIFLWILSQADAEGRYRCASVRGLSRAAAVSYRDATRAIETLEAPDPDSTTSTNLGRRISRIDGGWQVLNYEKYREYRTQKQIDDAERQKRHRDMSRDVTVTSPPEDRGQRTEDRSNSSKTATKTPRRLPTKEKKPRKPPWLYWCPEQNKLRTHTQDPRCALFTAKWAKLLGNEDRIYDELDRPDGVNDWLRRHPARVIKIKSFEGFLGNWLAKMLEDR